jgi:hypothetical protein
MGLFDPEERRFRIRLNRLSRFEVLRAVVLSEAPQNRGGMTILTGA